MLLSDVHGCKVEDHVLMFFNELGQPIGPIEKACDEFSKFLGTIAHVYSWTPLIYTNWDKVLRYGYNVGIYKCKYIFSELKKLGFLDIYEILVLFHKYILPQTKSVKKWVLESIACAWRVFKSRLKANHYYKYDNDAERWKHRPSRIPDSHFKLLLQYWNTSMPKKISAQNSKSHGLLDNMHTVGPVSFARIYQKLIFYSILAKLLSCFLCCFAVKFKLGRNYASNLPIREPPSHIRIPRASLLLFLYLHRLKLSLLHSQGDVSLDFARTQGSLIYVLLMFDQIQRRTFIYRPHLEV
ncbi:hypothetical protein Cgig2_003390 [Carnegiea gigantea]|uniref:Uncharacterized protein n=1 Tax=Carnegiea gigantea TaxID=171969 RepID=A0A9Q1JPW9_9CARY|nr:hypothetical protein Cgig2_003390 [Carnegiea gigantea]